MAEIVLQPPYTELRKAPRIDLASAVPLAWPFTINIDPTNICNFHCSCCVQSLPDYKERAGYHQHMSIELYRRIIDEIRSFGGVKSLKLYAFGESLLHPNIGEMARLADTASERVELTTNGTPLTAALAQQLIDAATDYLRISIYKDTEDQHSYTGLIRRNVQRLRDLRDDQNKTKPYIVVKVFTPAELPAVKDFYDGIADEVEVEGFHSIGSDRIPTEQLTGPQVACTYAFYTMVVKSNGDVVPCCGAWETSLVAGNLNDSTLAEIWRGEKLANIQRLHLMGRRRSLPACARCDTLFNTPDSIDALSVCEYDSRCERRRVAPEPARAA